ncbi:MAG TPA: endopeptidase La [Patescibacteria group bacterium]|nr:endopeptidase La [Patescibacteria group bacterium]
MANDTNKLRFQRTVPVVAIRDSVVFPHTDSILSFGRAKSIDAVNAAFQDDKIIAIFNQKDPNVTDPTPEDLYEIGTIATVTQMMSTDDEIHAMIKGQARVRLDEVLAEEPYFIAKVSELSETDIKTDEVTALSNQLYDIFKRAVNLGKGVEITTVMKILSGNIEPIELVDSVSSLLDVKSAEKQKILEILSVKDRFKRVIELMGHEVNVLDLEKTISMKTQKKLEDQMKKAMLREKKRVIEEELEGGDEDSDLSELKEYKKKIKAAKMPKETESKALKELKRLEQMSANNPESGYVRNYLDWLVEMPWSNSSPNNVSVKKAGKILDEEHFAIDKTKERILEYLSVMKMKEKAKKAEDSQPTILCFVGPPGVGKTSIGKSIAKALGRKFVRVSLGGIRDEAEIRGHRRTYVGAMPGRIIQGMKNAGTNNPVFMLDEIDKLGMDYRGDPSSALLEILDPEQNKEFSDHYLEVPFDLSKVIFIATGNVTDTIPGPLLDRMEVIRFAGYTTDEKFEIGDKFLWPKVLKLHGIDDRKIKIEKRALKEIIESYTREAGVRNLERNLATICRKVAREIAEKGKYPKVITLKDVVKFLGPRKFSSQIAEKKDDVGIVTGLSVTTFGGEILFIEVSLMPGTGKLILTGQLGSVMKESVKAAYTWTRSHWRQLGLPENFARDMDIHVHVPEGAIPKDGPSAGVSMTTALVSALTHIPVRKDVAMTGEITLRGRVLEIGGLKEKVIAAHRAGIKTIIAPKDNEKDMVDVPQSVKDDVKFYFVDHYEEIPPIALKGWKSIKQKETVTPTVATV